MLATVAVLGIIGFSALLYGLTGWAIDLGARVGDRIFGREA